MSIKFVPNRDAYQQMNSQLAKEHIHPMVNRIAAKANEASSWPRDSYRAWEGDYLGRVDAFQASNKDSDRARRLLGLLGQESV